MTNEPRPPTRTPAVQGAGPVERRSVRRRRAVWRRRAAATAFVLIIGFVLAGWLTAKRLTAHHPSATIGVTRTSRRGGPRSPEHFAVSRLPYKLPAALQDTAGVPLGSGRVVLLGGLNAADTSTAAVSVLDAHGVKAAANLAEAQHDAQGVLLDGQAYVFGGGQFNSYDHILSFNPDTDNMTQVGSLPTPTSDAAVAVIAGTAYVVGGYNGVQALDTIIAWRPGSHPQLVARLPYGLRYAAVAASGSRLLIVGGSHDEAATTTILSFDPATHNVQHIGDLPSPITHAAAIALGSYVYILGGRGSTSGTQSAAILAIDPATGHSVQVGRLPQPLSDAAAIPLGDRVWLAGGLSANGTVNSVLELTPRPL
jgi:N-acetylneuraminic acid mutarotase